MGRLAAEYGLHPLYRREFHDVFDEFREIPEFKDLLTRMKVVDRNEETDMDEDQWEAARACLFSLPPSARLPVHGVEFSVHIPISFALS